MRRIQTTAPGRVLRARTVNDLIDSNNRLSGVRAPRESDSAAGPTPISIRRAEIVEIGIGYLFCKDPDLGQGEEARRTFYVAMPALFRLTAHDGVTYVYTDGNTRTASKTGETDETHLLTPRYVVGDTIMAASPVEFGTGLTGIPNEDSVIDWLDMNVDGRQWAKSA